MSITIPGSGKRAPKHAAKQDREEVSVADVLRAVPEQDITAPKPVFIPKELAATGAQPVLADTAVLETVPPVTEDRSFLERLASDLRGLDFGALDQAQESGITYAEALAERPLMPAQSVPGYCEGIVRGLLIAALWDAARWYRDLDGEACDDCGTEAGWLCDRHITYLALAGTYEELHDFTTRALTDEVALERVLASCRDERSGTADAGDLGSPGSPVALLLEKALTAGGER